MSKTFKHSRGLKLQSLVLLAQSLSLMQIKMDDLQEELETARSIMNSMRVKRARQ